MTTNRKLSRSTRSAGRLVLGLYLVIVGGLVLIGNLGYDLPRDVWQLWPLLVIGMGAIKLLWPGEKDDRSGGFWILIGGLYCALSAWNLFGLHWGTAWPVFLVAAGIEMVGKGMFNKVGTGRSDDEK